MTTTTFSGEVHPLANLFPMLPPEELQELADTIKEDGQLFPIILSVSGRLLDGRNRLAACKLAKVEPVFEVYEGDEAIFALKANTARRSLTKGQLAMIGAQSQVILEITSEVIPEITQTQIAAGAGVSRQRVVYASTVLKYAPDLAEQVVSGALALNEAYRTAQSRKVATEQTAQALQDLQEQAPDLADLVTEESLSLAEAHAASKERARDKQERIARKVEHINAARAGIDRLLGITELDEWPDIIASMSADDAAETLALVERLR